MTKNDLQAILESVFVQLGERHVCDDDWKEDIDADAALADCGVTSFDAGGYLTRDAGLVVRLPDGSEFQITIVQSGFSSDDDED